MLRRRAAYLHIAKCAGSSITAALIEAAGRPGQPGARFDSCYTAGPHPRSMLGPDAQALIIDESIDPPDPGPYVLGTHWSLTTLRRWFAEDDIATVLREPAGRLLSYVLFARTLGQAGHRFWYPDDLGALIVRRPLTELLEWEPATRAIDNLVLRQIMWRDERIVTDRFLPPATAAALAADAVGLVDRLGFTGVIEAPERTIDGLSTWLGVPIAPGRDNVTPHRGAAGLLRRRADVDRAHELLRARTTGDRAIWTAVATRFDVDPEACDRRVGQRLAGLCDSAFLVGWQPGTRRQGASDRHAATRSGRPAIVDGARVVAVGLDPARDSLAIDALASSGAAEVTIVTDVPDARLSAAADELAVMTDPSMVSLQDVLVGRDADAAVIGRSAVGDPPTGDRLRELDDALLPGAPFLLTWEPDDPTAAVLRDTAGALGRPLRLPDDDRADRSAPGPSAPVRRGLARLWRVGRRLLGRRRG